MIIKPSEKRIKFERLLKELGYKDQSPILKKEEKRKKQTNYVFEDGAMAIYVYVKPYFNKKSYLYEEFLDHYDDSDIKDKIKSLAKIILYKERTRIAEVEWEAVYTKQPTDFTLEQRKKVFFDFMRQTKLYLYNGLLDLNPKEGDILAANPRGPKIDKGFTEESLALGAKQRSIVDRKFGFGEVYNDGFQYCRYDKDLFLKPI